MKTETSHAGGFLASEANGTRSRDVGTLLMGENLKAGAVLGKVSLGAATSAAKAGGNTGNGAMGAVTVGGTAQTGIHTLRVTAAAANAGAFEVKDPQGDVVGTGNVGTAFSGGGLSFTLADGGTDFIVGDGFDITVAEGSLKYVELDTAGTNGSQIAAALLYDAVDATDADMPCVVIDRDAEIDTAALVWPTGITTDQKSIATAQLETLGLIAR